MKKVFFILTYTPDPRLLRKIRSFVKYNFEVGLIFAKRAHEVSPFIANNLSKVYNLSFCDTDVWLHRLHETLKFFRRADKIIKKEKPSIIYISAFDGLMMNYIGRWQEGAVILYEVSDLPGGRWRRNKIYRSLIDRVERLFVKKVDKIILTSPYFYPEKYQKHKAEILILENLPEKRLFDKYCKFAHGDFVVGFFGLIRHRKSIESLIKALGGMNGVRVIIAGSAAIGREDYGKIMELSLCYNNIKFKGGYDYENDIVGFYSSIDCVYSVYDKDDENTQLALGNKLYEAIVCCLPIIVTRGSKMAKFVEAAGIGFSVDPDNPYEIRNAVSEMMRDKGIVRRIENNCLVMRKNYYYEIRESGFMTEVNNMLEDIKV